MTSNRMFSFVALQLAIDFLMWLKVVKLNPILLLIIVVVIPATEGKTVNADVLERRFMVQNDRQLGNTVDTVENKMQIENLSTIDNLISR